jgi:hypothetical protein
LQSQSLRRCAQTLVIRWNNKTQTLTLNGKRCRRFTYRAAGHFPRGK